jgi:hypothetical protein
MSRLKTYRVTFTSTSHMRIDIRASRTIRAKTWERTHEPAPPSPVVPRRLSLDARS